MKNKNINLNIKLGNKVFYSLITIIILVAVAGIAIALENWEIIGHDPNYIGLGANSVQTRLCAVETALNMEDASCTENPSCTSPTDCINENPDKPFCISGSCVECRTITDCDENNDESCSNGICIPNNPTPTCTTGNTKGLIPSSWIPMLLPKDSSDRICGLYGCEITIQGIKISRNVETTVFDNTKDPISFEQLEDGTWEEGDNGDTTNTKISSKIVISSAGYYVYDDSQNNVAIDHNEENICLFDPTKKANTGYIKVTACLKTS